MAIAMSTFAQVNIGAGYTNNAAKTTAGSTESNGTENGFFVEGDYAISLGESLSIIPGIRYTYLSAQSASDVLGGLLGLSGKVQEHYVAVPVSAQFALDLGSAKLLLFAGPTFNLGLSSKTIGEAVTEVISASKTVDNFKDMNLEKVDVLVGGGVGIAVGKMAVKAGYDFGLLDRNSGDQVTRKDATIHAGAYFTF